MPYFKNLKINRAFKGGYYTDVQMYTRSLYEMLEKYYYPVQKQNGRSISKTMDGCQ